MNFFEGTIDLILDKKTLLCLIDNKLVFLYNTPYKINIGMKIKCFLFHQMFFKEKIFFLFCKEHSRIDIDKKEEMEENKFVFEIVVFIQKNKKNIQKIIEGLFEDMPIEQNKFIELISKQVLFLNKESSCFPFIEEDVLTDIFESDNVFINKKNNICSFLFCFKGNVSSARIVSISSVIETIKRKKKKKGFIFFKEKELFGAPSFILGVLSAKENGHLTVLDSTGEIDVCFLDERKTDECFILASIYMAVVEYNKIDKTKNKKISLVIDKTSVLLSKEKKKQKEIKVKIKTIHQPRINLGEEITFSSLSFFETENEKGVLLSKNSSFFSFLRPGIFLIGETEEISGEEVKILITTENTSLCFVDVLPEKKFVSDFIEEKTSFSAVLVSKNYLLKKSRTKFSTEGECFKEDLFKRYSVGSPFRNRIVVYEFLSRNKKKKFKLFWDQSNTISPQNSFPSTEGLCVYVDVYNVQKRKSSLGEDYFYGDATSFMDIFLFKEDLLVCVKEEKEENIKTEQRIFIREIGSFSFENVFELSCFIEKIEKIEIFFVCFKCGLSGKKETCSNCYNVCSLRGCLEAVVCDETGSVFISINNKKFVISLFFQRKEIETIKKNLEEISFNTITFLNKCFLEIKNKRFIFVCLRKETITPLFKKTSSLKQIVNCIDVSLENRSKEIFRLLRFLQ